MTFYSVSNPFMQIFNLQGTGLNLGHVYFGVAGQDPITHPKTVYWDAAGTNVAPQPIDTSGGYLWRSGTPTAVYIDTAYSIKVLDKNGATVYYQANVNDAVFLAIQELQSATTDIENLLGATVIYASDSPSVFKTKWESSTGQIAIESGDYTVPALSTSVNFLNVYSLGGAVNIYRSTTGPLWTHTGDYATVTGITFRGASLAGDVLSFTGQGCSFLNCGGVDTPDLALKSLKYTFVHGSNPNWGKIQIGQSGTPTLYSQLINIYTSTATDGITLIDNGSQIISGCQIGPLTIQSGTGPAGVNGGMMVGNRILGAVTVGLSSATFTGNQFGAVAITFNAGTGGCSMDSSNIYETGCTITNNGNLNNLIMRNTLAGGVIQISYGDDTNKRLATISPNDPTTGFIFDGSLIIPNALSYRAANHAGTGYLNVAVFSGVNDNLTIGDNAPSGSTSVQSGGGGVYAAVSGASITHTSATSFNPQTDNTTSCGLAGQRWNTVYAATGTINTSDGNAKRDVREIDAAEKVAAETVKTLWRAYRMKDAVAKKGEAARVHFGVIAQDIEAAFAEQGLDAHRYGLFCYDEWDAKPAEEAKSDDDGNVIQPYRAAVEAGSRYGIRYEELFAFMLAAL